MADHVDHNSSGHDDLVSVIMPAFNAGKYISDAVQSVIQQTYSNWELIVIDDGSADNTAAIVKKFAMSDGRIRYIHQENGGPGKARNNGLKQAKGTYVAFVDADDLWMPEKLQAQVTTIHYHKTDLVFSDAYIFESIPSQEKKANVSPGFYNGEKGTQQFLFCNHIPMLTVLAKASALKAVGGFSERRDIHEDYHLWIRLLIRGCIFFGSDRPLAWYRIHADSSTATDGRVVLYAINSLLDIKSLYPKYSAEIDRSVLALINKHLTKVNVSGWNMAQHLLEIRNSLPGEPVSIPAWKKIYNIFGKEIFRRLFNLRMRSKTGPVNHKTLTATVV